MHDDLPLLCATPAGWEHLAAADLGTFLADHAVCEQQAALSALSLIGHYPDDEELVDRMTSLAAEEILHLRRVATLLRRRGLPPARRRTNPWVIGLKARMTKDREPARKVDRLLVGALIEARSCERFTRLGAVIEDEEVAELLRDLGPAERRHWLIFHRLAARHLSAADLDRRFRYWLEIERDLTAGLGRAPTVHG